MTEKTNPEQPAAVEQDNDEFRVEDRRHWADEKSAADGAVEGEGPEGDEQQEVFPARPSVVDEYRLRAEKAEQTLQEYIDAYKKFKSEQEQARERQTRRVEQEVSLKFGELLGEQLEFLDDLERAMSHARSSDDQATLIEGLEIACRRFMSTLQGHGVEPFSPTGEAFDPNRDEAVRVDTEATAEQDGVVTETLRAGYLLDGRVLRAARVAVGRHVKPRGS